MASGAGVSQSVSRPDWNDDPPYQVPEKDWDRVVYRAEDVPGVQRLLQEGWVLAPDPPVWGFLPAIWPRDRRTWVADLLTRRLVVYDGSDERHETWTQHDVDESEADADLLCALAGVPPRPSGRIWLLRPINGWSPDRVCAEALGRIESQPGGKFRASNQLTDITAQVIAQAISGG